MTARLVGINHVALEVGDLDEALAFYGRIFDIELRGRVRSALESAGAEILPGRGLSFRDPWGNHLQVVEYGDIQFTKTPVVLRGMGLEGLEKRPEALAELGAKGLDPGPD